MCACAYTHAAARLVGGITVASRLRFDAKIHDEWILIDTVSLLPIDTLGMLARAKLEGAKFVCFGDYDGPFVAVCDRWDHCGSVKSSERMVDMCHGLHVPLTTYWKGDIQGAL